jgi:hypothetical protein
MDTIIADLKKIISKLERYNEQYNGELLSPDNDGYAVRSPRQRTRTDENTVGKQLNFYGGRKRSKTRKTRKTRK